MPLRLALAPPSRAPARGYFLMVLQQPHRSWARVAAASSASSSSCEQYPQAPITAAPGATSPREEKGNGELEAAVRGGEKASGAQQDGSTGTGVGVPSPPAPKDSEALRAAAAAGRKGRSGALSRQRCRMAKPHGNKPARPGSPKEGRGGGGGIIHATPRSSSASSTSPSTSSTRLRATKKQESED